jgi:hypothetical protein
MTDTITVHLTPGELRACFNALISQTLFNTTEQRQDNESALIKINQAYREQ